MVKVNMNKLVSLILGLLVSTQVLADGVSALQDFYRSTNSMRATFHQEVKDGQGNMVQKVEGKMQLDRPNKFRWDYNKPYEQQIISDGKEVFLLDVELEQVTIRTLNQTLGMTPAALLAGGEGVEENFILKNVGRQPYGSSIDWVQALPKVEDSGFESIYIGFKGGELRHMKMVDSFSHITTIAFNNVERNPTLATETFSFQIPEGIDVVGE
jgi:outer membrane lipoprotein carrier protein